MRAAAILGPGSSEKDLRPFQAASASTWMIGLPASAADADVILVLGGDGTIHRHLAQFSKLGLPVLIVPCGSGNDFARALELRNLHDSLAAFGKFTAHRGNVRSVDLGLVTPLDSVRASDGARRLDRSRYFCCAGGVGLDAEVARRANQLPRWLRGHGGYVLSLPGALWPFKAMAMTVSFRDDGSPGGPTRPTETPKVLAAFANASAYGGGIKIAPAARLDDGRLDVCLVADMNKLKLLCLFPTAYFGRHLMLSEVETFQTSGVRLETETPRDVYADGEYVCQTPIEVTVAPRALQVVTP
jgi:diacylglycerol kinase (ATP)